MAAGLAGDAEFQRVHHFIRGQRVRPELAGNRQPQRVGAASRNVLLVAGRAVGRAHHAALELPAGAVVVAHLDRALKAAAGAGIGRPVERGLQFADAIVRPITKQRTVVHFWRIDDLAGIEQIVRIEALLDLAEIGNDARAEHRLMEFGANQPVAMLAGVRALVFAHHLEGFFGDGPHRLDVLFELQIEDRAHMQAALGGMRIHGAAGAVLGEDGVEPLGIVGEVRQRHRAILDKGDRLALLLHRHHDVEAGGAEIGDAGLQGGFGDLDHAAPFALRLVPAKAEVGHQFAELLQAMQVFGLVLLGEFDDQHRIGIAAHGGLDDRLEHRDVAAERNHGAVDQFDRDRPQLHQMLRRIHRLVKAAEMADTEHLVADDRPQLEFDLRGEGQRAFGADQQMRHVVRRIARHQRIEIVAADAALHLWKSLRYLGGLALAEIEHVAE